MLLCRIFVTEVHFDLPGCCRIDFCMSLLVSPIFLLHWGHVMYFASSTNATLSFYQTNLRATKDDIRPYIK